MEQYSRRFIEELEKHIDPTIIEFFEKKLNFFQKYFLTKKLISTHTSKFFSSYIAFSTF